MYVIFPTHCLASSSGLMVGIKKETEGIICVVEVVSAVESKTICSSTRGCFLGLWYRYNCSQIEGINLTDRPELVLFLPPGAMLPKVYSNSEEVVVILYNQPKPYTYLTIEPLTLRSQSDSEILDRQVMPVPEDTESHIEDIIFLVNTTHEVNSINNSRKKSQRFGGFSNFILVLPNLIFSILIFISKLVNRVSNLAIFRWNVIRYPLSLSLLLKQFSLRFSQIKKFDSNVCATQSTPQALNCLNDNSTRKKQRVKELHEKQRQLIVNGSLITCIVVDVVIGILVVRWLTSTNIIVHMADFLLVNTEYVAQILTQLIHWLMGVPAGLKLNKTLTNFLGKFFLYHIYLWQTYLRIIQPYLQTLLWICILSGCFGLTFLITLASDVLSILTLHIYCFYVYAARLYSLQVYALSSLARLFTGKKWNILRSRVDSLPYDVDRLFIGTLLFTVLLFLLPTTALFYLVFTSLRLLVHLIKSLLCILTHVINKIPVFGVALLFLRPSMLPGGLHIEICDSCSAKDTIPCPAEFAPSLPYTASVLYLKLLNKPLTVSQLFDWPIDSGHVTDDKQDTWGTFLGKLMRGHLIYPWIERH